MFVETYLFFDGQCAEAMAHYQRVLGGDLQVMRYQDAPPCAQCPNMGADTQDRVMHAILKFPDGALMASDVPAGDTYEGIQGVGVTLNFPGLDDARRTFDTLADGGSVQMPFGPTFWAEGFGMLRDRFGTPWLINGPMIMPNV
ncbi:VOC family protein [Achromobacter sp. GG226]|uniref:VOC family protein n=1 Tax=Verticiella alkaliphila TaxID=2779529 RepID=UPI001C0BC6E3|nr:VOC family protein [Verticiella sp. GG226]MBU4608995.1 VOC family protein [Verticiella sp. GG226]